MDDSWEQKNGARFRKFGSLALLVVLFAAAPSVAQSGERGSLEGRLTDLYSHPLAATTVVLWNSQTGAEAHAITTKPEVTVSAASHPAPTRWKLLIPREERGRSGASPFGGLCFARADGSRAGISTGDGERRRLRTGFSRRQRCFRNKPAGSGGGDGCGAARARIGAVARPPYRIARVAGPLGSGAANCRDHPRRDPCGYHCGQRHTIPRRPIRAWAADSSGSAKAGPGSAGRHHHHQRRAIAVPAAEWKAMGAVCIGNTGHGGNRRHR